MADQKNLEEIFGYTFTNSTLLKTALTHPSLSYESKGSIESNQRLEFLGDAVLQIIISRYLYDTFPKFAEGKLTKLRARLVSGKAFESIARRLDLGNYLTMSKSEDSSGGREKSSALADVVEALIGAIYLDGGIDEAQRVALQLIDPLLQKVIETPEEANPKGQLQEILQEISPLSPSYKITNEEGPPHQRVFTAIVEWQDSTLGTGSGLSKQAAETLAAKAALKEKPWK